MDRIEIRVVCFVLICSIAMQVIVSRSADGTLSSWMRQFTMLMALVCGYLLGLVDESVALS